jgi:hypothetical protein
VDCLERPVRLDTTRRLQAGDAASAPQELQRCVSS